MTELSLPFRPAPMPFVLLLDEPVRYVRAHFRAIFPAVAIPVAILSTVAAVAQAVDLRATIARGTVRAGFWSPGVLLIALALGLVALFAYTAGQVAALDVLAGRPVSMQRAWRFALRPAVWGTLLMVAGAVVVSLFCCFLPLFYVAPLLAFTLPVMVEESTYGFPALARSATLARHNPGGRWFDSPIVKVLLLILVGTLITYLAGLLVALPFQLPMFIGFWRDALAGKEDIQGAMGRWIWFQVPAQFLSALVRTAIYLYTAFGMGLLFNDVRGRKEGVDLRSEIDLLFPAQPAGAPWP